jgi:hypothetical protein
MDGGAPENLALLAMHVPDDREHRGNVPVAHRRLVPGDYACFDAGYDDTG